MTHKSVTKPNPTTPEKATGIKNKKSDISYSPTTTHSFPTGAATSNPSQPTKPFQRS